MSPRSKRPCKRPQEEEAPPPQALVWKMSMPEVFIFYRGVLQGPLLERGGLVCSPGHNSIDGAKEQSIVPHLLDVGA